jgi:CheY-like chemotaxis protein
LRVGGLTNKTHPTFPRDDSQTSPNRAANNHDKTRSHQSPLTDVMMAGMSGPQLAERVRLDYPAIAVVFDGIRVALLLVD